MNENPIGIFDSGIGGLTIVNELKKRLPKENYFYYADSKNCPYGEKSKEELFEICSNIIEFLLEKKCKLIIIACNTATTSCMKDLREKYPQVPIVGIVPAIKVAYDHGKTNTLMMATPHTIKSERVKELVRDFKSNDQKMTLLSCYNLAPMIEEDNEEEINLILENLFMPYKEENFDSIVLGCTHYPMIKHKIKNYFPNAELIDGSVGISKEVERQLELNNLKNKNIENSTMTFYNTKEEKNEKYYFDYLQKLD